MFVQPILVVGLGFGLSFAPTRVLLSLAAAGGVALLHRFLHTDGVEVKDLPSFSLPKLRRRAKVEVVTPPKKRRVPQL